MQLIKINKKLLFPSRSSLFPSEDARFSKENLLFPSGNLLSPEVHPRETKAVNHAIKSNRPTFSRQTTCNSINQRGKIVPKSF